MADDKDVYADVVNLDVVRGQRDMVQHEGGGISMGPDGVKLFRLLTIKNGLQLEIRTGGRMRLTSKAPACWTIAKKEFGLKGDRKKVYKAFCEMHGLEPEADCLP